MPLLQFRFALVWLCAAWVIGGCSHPPDAGLGPEPARDPWVACVATADGYDPGHSVLADAPADTLPVSSGYAEGQVWFRNGEPIRLGRREYVRWGRLRRLDPDGFTAKGIGLVRVGEHGGVPLYAEAPGEKELFRVLWVPLRPGCLFQSYQWQSDRGMHADPQP